MKKAVLTFLGLTLILYNKSLAQIDCQSPAGVLALSAAPVQNF